MTTIVGIKRMGQIVLAADRRLAEANSILGETCKILEHTDVQGNVSFVGVAGPHTSLLALRSIFKEHDIHLQSEDYVYESFLTIHGILKEQHYVNPTEFEGEAYESSQLQCMIANESGLYLVSSGREVMTIGEDGQGFNAIGSGRALAIGALNVLEAISTEGLGAQAVLAVVTASLYDSGTNSNIDTRTVKCTI
jgi:ATP-dependent HslUV protease subunit HslV